MHTRTHTLDHITYATEWPHVRAAFIAVLEIDGDRFERATEQNFSSKAVMDAAAALEKAILKEMTKDAGGAEVRTMKLARARKPSTA